MEAVLVFALIVFVGLMCAEAMFRLTCRATAKPCPRCGSRWQTELTGEWAGEMWTCRACRHNWETDYE